MSSAAATMNATTNTNVATAAKNKPIDPADFDVAKLRFGTKQPNKNGFDQYQIHYDREDTKDTKCIIKFSDVVVNSIMDPAMVKAKKAAKGGPVAPVLDAKGQPVKPNYSLSVKITDPAHLKCLEAIETFTKNHIFKNKVSMLTKADKFKIEDIDNTFKDMLYRDEKRDYPLFSVSFPFGDEREPVEVKYLDKTVPRAVVESTNPEEKIGRDSVVDVFVYLKNLKIDSGNSINIRRSAFSIVKVKQYVAPSVGGGASGKPMNGELIENIDTSKIEIGGVEVNKSSGKSIKPKIKYTAGDGSEKTKYISIFLPAVPIKFRKTVNKDDGKISFSACYEPSAEHLEKFKALDAYFKKAIFDKFAKKEFKASDFGVKTMTDVIWDGRYRGAVSDSNPQYAPSLWFTVYSEADPVNPDKFEFKGNFFNTNGTPYTNEEVASKIIGERFTCDLNIYLKHVWLGAKAYSLKYNVGNVTLDLVANEYDLGEDTYFDGEVAEADDGTEPESNEGSPSAHTAAPVATTSQAKPATTKPAAAPAATQVEDSSEEEEEEESEEEETDEDA
jgi:hypothetical protein